MEAVARETPGDFAVGDEVRTLRLAMKMDLARFLDGEIEAGSAEARIGSMRALAKQLRSLTAAHDWSDFAEDTRSIGRTDR